MRAEMPPWPGALEECSAGRCSYNASLCFEDQVPAICPNTNYSIERRYPLIGSNGSQDSMAVTRIIARNTVILKLDQPWKR